MIRSATNIVVVRLCYRVLTATVKCRLRSLPFYPHQAYVFTFILSILFVFGLFANALTFFVIATCKLRRSVFNIFLLSLCVSDFVSALFSPIFIYRRTWGYQTWHIPAIICKIYFGVDQWTSVVTTAHITIFSILRLMYVRWPRFYGKINRSHAQISVSIMWVVTFLVGFIPFFMFCGLYEQKRVLGQAGNAWPVCSLLVNWIHAFRVYAYIGYPIFFYLPIVFVSAISVTIGVLLSKRRRLQEKLRQARAAQIPASSGKRLKKDRKALVQLSLIVGSFLVGYVPHVVYHFWATSTIPSTQYMRNIDWIFGMLEYTCLRFSECMNPVLYNLSSSKIRKQTMLLLTRCRRIQTSRLLPRRSTTRAIESARTQTRNQIELRITTGTSMSPS